MITQLLNVCWASQCRFNISSAQKKLPTSLTVESCRSPCKWRTFTVLFSSLNIYCSEKPWLPEDWPQHANAAHKNLQRGKEEVSRGTNFCWLMKQESTFYQNDGKRKSHRVFIDDSTLTEATGWTYRCVRERSVSSRSDKYINKSFTIQQDNHHKHTATFRGEEVEYPRLAESVTRSRSGWAAEDQTKGWESPQQRAEGVYRGSISREDTKHLLMSVRLQNIFHKIWNMMILFDFMCFCPITF